ncbi:TPA: hypothetical protein U2B43_001802 [Streptococcus suis]|nr:hypothetical protein [Streptococcus suis]
MKYITEDDLRLIYRDNPFETFTIQAQTRLTPGAKTFLTDRRIAIIDERNNKHKQTATFTKCKQEESMVSLSNEWLQLRCECLQIAYSLLDTDFSIAEELCMLEQTLAMPVEQSSHSIVVDEVQLIDRSCIVEHLGRLRVLLKSQRGKILSQLFPLYFKMEAFSEKIDGPEKSILYQSKNRLAHMITGYIKKSEDVAYVSKQIT